MNIDVLLNQCRQREPIIDFTLPERLRKVNSDYEFKRIRYVESNTILGLMRSVNARFDKSFEMPQFSVFDNILIPDWCVYARIEVNKVYNLPVYQKPLKAKKLSAEAIRIAIINEITKNLIEYLTKEKINFMQPVNNKSLVAFLFGQMEKLDNGEIKAEQALAQSKIASQINQQMRYELDRVKVMMELTKHNAIYKDGTQLREVESKKFDNELL